MQTYSANQHHVIIPSWLLKVPVIKKKNALCLGKSAFSNFVPYSIKKVSGLVTENKTPTVALKARIRKRYPLQWLERWRDERISWKRAYPLLKNLIYYVSNFAIVFSPLSQILYSYYNREGVAAVYMQPAVVNANTSHMKNISMAFYSLSIALIFVAYRVVTICVSIYIN